MTVGSFAHKVCVSRGGVAQLGERSVRNAEVVSSILIASTKNYGHLKEISSALFLLCIQDVHTSPLVRILPHAGEAINFSISEVLLTWE